MSWFKDKIYVSFFTGQTSKYIKLIAKAYAEGYKFDHDEDEVLDLTDPETNLVHKLFSLDQCHPVEKYFSPESIADFKKYHETMGAAGTTLFGRIRARELKRDTSDWCVSIVIQAFEITTRYKWTALYQATTTYLYGKNYGKYM